MHVKQTHENDTKLRLTITDDEKHLAKLKAHVLKKMAPNVKVQGFRAGHVPLEIVEKNINPDVFQTEFLDEAINHLYQDAINDAKLRPVSNPQITLKKFVPFTTLEFEAELEVVGDIVLPDYTKIRVARPTVEVTAKDVSDVLENLRTRAAERKEVERAAKDGDELLIDFTGSDEKGKGISGADGKDYPLLLGSNTFIPGFEENLLGLKAGENKTFKVTFPKDYGVSALQSKKVTFDVSVKKVQAVELPKADDAFAAQSGPFKTLAELKTDIKRQVGIERNQQAERDYENEIMHQIAHKTAVAIPKVLIDEQLERLWREVQQNLIYRGMTAEEFLAAEGMSESEYKEKMLGAQATERVKGGLILSEIADREKLTVSEEELTARVRMYKAQYQDAAMQAELDKPENQRDIVARILTEKTLAKLVEYASGK